MQLGEVSPGGVGTGLYGMLVMVVITVFISGLMVGRTPELLGKPGARKLIISLEAVKFVPVIIDRIDALAFGAEQIAAELKIIGRIGKNHIHARIWKCAHPGDAIAHDDPVERQFYCLCLGLTDLFQNPHLNAPNQHRTPVVSHRESCVKS